MEVLAWLIPVSLVMGGLGLCGFLYALRTRQFDDLKGAARRVLTTTHDDHPAG